VLLSLLFLTLFDINNDNNNNRYFYLKFKSRQERNDALCGFRKLIADIQIFEGADDGNSGDDGRTSPFRGVLNKIKNNSNNKNALGTPSSKGGRGKTPASLKTTTVFGAGGQSEAKKMVLLEYVG